jgi:hypothetical protein
LIDDDRARNQQKEVSTLEETLAMTKEVLRIVGFCGS